MHRRRTGSGSAGRAGLLGLVLALAVPFAQAQVLIDFDDRPAPSCPFSGAERLADQWAGQGVIFSAPPPAQTGAIQDRDACSWPVSGHSPPNIVAGVAGLADLPLAMAFDPPVSSVSLLATNWRGIDDITLTARDAGGAEVGSDTISTIGMVGPLQLLEVVGSGIVTAELTNSSFNDDVAFDDLRFTPEAAALEACCFGDGSCLDLDPVGCAGTGGTAQGPGSGCASVSCPPPPVPGWVPDGASRPGEPLRITKEGPGALRLRWSQGCSPEALDLGVHEGAIGDWYSHEAVLCDTGGARTEASLVPAAGNRYFLVAAFTASEEGSYGLDSFGEERPASPGAACAPVQTRGCP